MTWWNGESFLPLLFQAVTVAQVPRRSRRTFFQSLLDLLYPVQHGGRFFTSADKCLLSFSLLEAPAALSIQGSVLFLCLRVGTLGKCGAHPAHRLEVKGFFATWRGQEAGAAFTPTARPLVQAQTHPRKSHVPTLPFRDLLPDRGRRDPGTVTAERQRALVAVFGRGRG